MNRSTPSAYRLFRAYVHTQPRRRIPRPEPKSDADRINLGLPLREPWFEVKPFDEKKMRLALSLKDTLQAQPKQRMELTKLSQLRRELDVHRQGKQRKMATYIRQFPGAFTLQSSFAQNNMKKQWFSFSADALKLLEEEERIFEDCEAGLVEKLRRILMISMKNRLPVAAVDKVRQCLGLPVDYRESIVKKYFDVFLLKERKGFLYVELKEWDEALAISALEKNTREGKYRMMMKKKRGDRQTNEENTEEAICEQYSEQISSKDYHDEALLVEGRKCQEGFITALNHKSASEEHSQMISQNNEGTLCQHRPRECSHQQDGFPLQNAIDYDLSSSKLESHQEDEFAFPQMISQNNERTLCQHRPRECSHQQDGLPLQNAIDYDSFSSKVESHQEDEFAFPLSSSSLSTNTNSGLGSVAEALNLSELNQKVNIEEDMYVMDKDEAEQNSVAETNKESQMQTAVAFGGESEVREGEKQSEGSGVLFENLTCLPFPWVLKKGKQPRINRAAVIESFQALPYISPYKNSRELVLPSSERLQTDKFVVGLIHEFLSLTLEKRATVQELELFRRPYQLPVNLVTFLLKYDGIFYVAKGTTKSHVFLKEAYKEFDLREKEPLLSWQERFVELAFRSPKSKEGTLKKQ